MKDKGYNRLTRIPGIIFLAYSMLLLGFVLENEWPGKRNLSKLESEASGIWQQAVLSIERVDASPFGSTGNHKELYTIRGDQKGLGFGYIGRVKTCRPGGCSRPSAGSINGDSFEYFDYLLIFNTKLEIKKIKILNYQATRGYEISSKAWLKQFSGYDGENSLNYGKNIQAISGATVSATSIIEDIKQTLNQLKKMKKQNKI